MDTQMTTVVDNNFKVRLIPISSLVSGQDAAIVRASQVAFDVTPTFSESGSVEYTSVNPVHMPGGIQVYKHTNARTFEIGAHLISRNVSDAIRNMANLQKLRSWRLPYFGNTDTLTAQNKQARESAALRTNQPSQEPLTEAQRSALVQQRIKESGVQLRGAPPDILYMYAYSSSSNDMRGAAGSLTLVNLNRIPVVLTNLSITWPEDVDYIPVYDPATSVSNKAEPWPVKIDVSLSLTETHSPREYEQFDLMSYKLGNLRNF